MRLLSSCCDDVVVGRRRRSPPFSLDLEALNSDTLITELNEAAISLALGTQDFGSQSFTRTLTAYLHLAAELVEAAGRADPEPAVALVRLLSSLDVAQGTPTPTATDFVEVFKRAVHVVEKAAYHDMRGNRAPAISPETLVCYYEAVVTMRLPVHSFICWERSRITLLLQCQVQASAFTASQTVRLLRAWAALGSPPAAARSAGGRRRSTSCVPA